MTFSFIHCADLHLDATLGDSVRERDAIDLAHSEIIQMRDAPLDALKNIENAAINNKVSAVIIAGDIFDTKESASKDQKSRSRFTAFLNSLNEHSIKVFVTLGNHDPVRSIQKISKTWPDNVYIFNSAQPETFTFNDGSQTISIHGVSYASNDEQRDLASLFPARVQGSFNIGVLHTNVGRDATHSNYAPSTINELSSFNYDYFALGHVHKRSILSQHPHISYSGNSQGLSAKPSEQEPKGCVLVRIDQPSGNVQSTFIETDTVRYITCGIKADEFLENDDIVTFVSEQISKECSHPEIFYLVRARLDIFGTIDTEQICSAVNDVRKNYFVTSLKAIDSNKTFSELTRQDDFYKSVSTELYAFAEPSVEEIYGKRASEILKYLSSTEMDKMQDVEQVIVKSVTELENSGA